MRIKATLQGFGCHLHFKTQLICYNYLNQTNDRRKL